MSETTQQNTDNQEIDLSQISKKIGSFFEGISNSIFRALLYFRRNVIWITIIVVIGVVLGTYLDKTNKSYNHKLIVCPNFGSNDYLYSKIELLNSKIKDNDTVFLRDVVGIKSPKKINTIKIEPILDVYKFIGNKDKDNNFELLKLMAEDGDIKKIVNEDMTSKNYPYHEIIFSTSGLTSEKNMVNPILNYLNNSEYYTSIERQYITNIKDKMVENDSIINQINAIISSFTNTVDGSSQKSDKLVYYNENSQLGEVIKTKNDLLYEQGTKRLELINLDKIIKVNSIALNITNTESINGKMKLIIPLFFLFIFISISYFIRYYKRQLAKLISK